jgi:hypothetical protein
LASEGVGADEGVGGNGQPDVLLQMVVIVLAADPEFMDLFYDKLNFQQAGEGHFFAHLQIVIHSDLILRVTKGA